MNLREQILETNDLPLEAVEVHEWKTTVYMRGMNASERDHWEMSIYENKGIKMDNIRARLVVLTLCDESGNRLFNDEEVEKLGKKNAKVINKLFEIAQRLSGIGQKDVEELGKN